MTRTRFFILGIFASISLGAAADVFNQFSPATGILKGSATSYITTAAASSDVTHLWSGTCNSSTFLRGDGACASAGGGGGGVTFTDGTNTVAAASQLTFVGGTISGTSPNAVVTIAGSAPATETQLGTVNISNSGLSTQTVPIVNPIPNGISGGGSGDCVSFTDGAGTVGDMAPQVFPGPCIVADGGGHPYLVLGASATITGTGCADASGGNGSQDNTGAVSATGIDTCTITFANNFGHSNPPHCVVSGYSATVLPYISTPPTVAAFVVHTAAAGTFSYVCL